MLSALPPLITWLELSGYLVRFKKGAEEALPVDLVHLRLDHISLDMGKLPSNLQTLIVTHFWSITLKLILSPYTDSVGISSAQGLFSFPPFLTHFEDRCPCDDLIPLSCILPKSLTTFIRERDRRMGNHLAEMISASSQKTQLFPWLHFEANEDALISDSHLAYFSTETHTMNLSWNSHITSEGLLLLPRNLTSLNLRWSSTAIVDSSVALLPRSLIELDMNCSSRITSEGLAHLPPGLTSLKWDRCYNLDKHGASLLPRSLTFLSLKENPKLPSDIFASLPRDLRTLDPGN
jgi:hypothetical protein